MVHPASTPSIDSRPFGTLPDGRAVEAWTLRGGRGLELEVLTFGGIVRSLRVPIVVGEPVDVVLGYPDLAGYLQDTFYMGATVGRIAGRIAGGRLRVGDTSYALPLNNGANHLHGGPGGLHRQLWRAEPVARPDGSPSLRLFLSSPAGDQGYPGKLKIAVTYTVTPENAFLFETLVESSEATPVSLTHHGYFNLQGETGKPVLDQAMQVHSDFEVPAGADMALSNERVAVAGAADLRAARRLDEVVPYLWQEHGALYWLGASRELKPAARVTEPASGLTLEVHTTQSCLQTYFGEGFDGRITGKSGKPFPRFAAFCLECQGYPEATNVSGFGDILVRPGQPQHHLTVHSFSSPS